MTTNESHKFRLNQARDLIASYKARTKGTKKKRGCSGKITVRIGGHRQREIESTPENVALIEAVHHFNVTGRMDAEGVAAKVSEIGGQEVSEATADKFLKMLFEPQCAAKSLLILNELTRLQRRAKSGRWVSKRKAVA